MNEPGRATTLRRIVGGARLAVGYSATLLRLGHADPDALPQGGGLAGGLFALDSQFARARAEAALTAPRDQTRLRRVSRFVDAGAWPSCR